jgi:hypothetical protein
MRVPFFLFDNFILVGLADIVSHSGAIPRFWLGSELDSVPVFTPYPLE